NLCTCMQTHAELSGHATPPKYRELLDAAREAAGIEQWPHNALRHSFASYHLAHFNDAAALALELGHTSAHLVFQHYRQLVRPKQAERYWKITPAVGSKKVVAFREATQGTRMACEASKGELRHERNSIFATVTVFKASPPNTLASF